MKDKRYKPPLLLALLLVVIIQIAVIVGAVRAANIPEDWPTKEIQPTPIPEKPSSPSEIKVISPNYSVGRQILPGGKVLEVGIIGSPPNPPPGLEAQQIDFASLREDSVLLPNFPSYSWVFGCSAVSGAMIAGYYDQHGYPNMYTGPTNGGVMPVTDAGWPTWIDSDGDTYPSNPLVASQASLDGRADFGSIEDYWVRYGSSAPDPFISGSWTQHDWGSAIGDYMKTSQSYYDNDDGSSAFWNYEGATKLYCSAMPDFVRFNDATYGRKLFYEARGYSVVACYNQKTDNQAEGGFSLADYQAEIDAGRPVFLNLQGHSIIGFGYSGSTIYIRNTWNSDPSVLFSMLWGGSYGGMELDSVSMVKLISSTPPGAFEKADPSDESTNLALSTTLSWTSSSGADGYEYCWDMTNDGTCTGWIDNGVDTSVGLDGLPAGSTFYWQVLAHNLFGTTYAEGSEMAFWQFTTGDLPGAFGKTSPMDESTGVSLSPVLSWSASSGVDRYDYCLDNSDNGRCDTTWVENGSRTSVSLNGLSSGTTYYWQVRAVNGIGTTYAEDSATAYWQFTTGMPPGAFAKIEPSNGEVNVSLSPTLYWASSSGANSYEYCIETEDDGICSGSWVNTGLSTSFDLSGLSPGATYFWQVRATNDFGMTYANGGDWSFTTVPPQPNTFRKSAPADLAMLVGLRPTLSWLPSEWADSYEYCLDETENDICDSEWVKNGANTTVELGSLTPWETYYWQVRAVNISGMTYADGSESAFWEFTTGDPPEDFNKLSPADALVGIAKPVILTWSESCDAMRYEVCWWVSADAGCSEWVGNGGKTSLVLQNLQDGTEYRWQVRAVNDGGTTYADDLESHFWSFHTAFRLHIPILLHQ